jgi:hypothetical protein
MVNSIIKGKKIRRLYGPSPFDESKMFRNTLWALFVAIDPNNYTDEEVTKANKIIEEFDLKNEIIESYLKNS